MDGRGRAVSGSPLPAVYFDGAEKLAARYALADHLDQLTQLIAVDPQGPSQLAALVSAAVALDKVGGVPDNWKPSR